MNNNEIEEINSSEEDNLNTIKFHPSIVSKALKSFQNDFQNAYVYQEQNIAKVDIWRKRYNGEPYGNENDGKSKIVSKDIKKISDQLISELSDPFINTPDIVRCEANIPSSTQSAIANEIVLNTQFCRMFDRFNFISQCVRTLVIDGTCVVKTGWEYNEDVRITSVEKEVNSINEYGNIALDRETGMPITEKVNELEEQLVVVDNKPTALLCRNEDIYIDPTCLGDFSKARFIIHIFEADLDTLERDGRYTNLDQLKLIEKTQDPYYIKDQYAIFDDKPRKKYIIYEYWGYYDVNEDGLVEPIVCAYVDNVVIRFDYNPFPDKKPPFIVCPLYPIPHKIYGESLAETLDDLQKTRTALLRGMIDNISKNNNSQVGIRKGTLDEINKKKFLNGQSFEYQGSIQDIFSGIYSEIPSSAFNMFQFSGNEAQSLVGVYLNPEVPANGSTGQHNVGRSPLSTGSVRKLHYIKSISDNLIKPLLRKWIAYNGVYLDQETIFRISNTEYKLVNRDDLYGEIDIDLTISTNEDNMSKAHQLSFLLQTIGSSEDPNIRKIIMSKIARLYKMPDLASMIENYQPQPSEMEMQMMMLQVEKLKAEIQNLNADSNKTMFMGNLQQQKMLTEQAKGEYLKSQIQGKYIDNNRKSQNIDDMFKMQQLREINQMNMSINNSNNQTKLLTELMKASQKGKKKNNEDDEDEYEPRTKRRKPKLL